MLDNPVGLQELSSLGLEGVSSLISWDTASFMSCEKQNPFSHGYDHGAVNT